MLIVEEDAEKLNEEGAMAFHNLVAKILYVSKRIQAPDINDWRKLSCLMEYLKVHRLCPLILSANGSGVLIWYVNASFAVHPNLRIQSSLLSMGSDRIKSG